MEPYRHNKTEVEMFILTSRGKKTELYSIWTQSDNVNPKEVNKPVTMLTVKLASVWISRRMETLRTKDHINDQSSIIRLVYGYYLVTVVSCSQYRLKRKGMVQIYHKSNWSSEHVSKQIEIEYTRTSVNWKVWRKNMAKSMVIIKVVWWIVQWV